MEIVGNCKTHRIVLLTDCTGIQLRLLAIVQQGIVRMLVGRVVQFCSKGIATYGSKVEIAM